LENISFRIKQIIDYKGISVRNFEQKIEASNGLIANSIKKSTDIQSKWLSKIIEIFPDINSSWLLCGIGEMLIENGEKDLIRPPNRDKCSNCEVLEAKLIKEESINADLRNLLAAKDEIITMLKAKASLQDNNIDNRKTA
jgi:hypothetical protein